MKDMGEKIDKSINQAPDCRKLKNLSNDVWGRIHVQNKLKENAISTLFKTILLVLCLLAFVGLLVLLLQPTK